MIFEENLAGNNEDNEDNTVFKSPSENCPLIQFQLFIFRKSTCL